MRHVERLDELIRYVEYYKLKEEQTEVSERVAGARALLARARAWKTQFRIQIPKKSGVKGDLQLQKILC